MAACYNIGDVGPAGGIIFALPFTGVNNTKYHYEIEINDIHTVGFNDPNISGCDTNISELGSEWGANSLNLSTSPHFGQGKKNTDIIAAVIQPPNGGVHPYIDSHDIAANQCLAHFANGINDWFLPSTEELQEAINQVGVDLGLNYFPVSNMSEADWWYLTSTEDSINKAVAITVSQLSGPSLGLITVGAVPVPKCRTFSVRPIRRFECDDRGINYDYRLSFEGGGTPGSCDLIEPSVGTGTPQVEYISNIPKMYVYQMPDEVLAPGTSLYVTNAVAVAFDSNTITVNNSNFQPTLPTAGTIFNTAPGFGPITAIETSSTWNGLLPPPMFAVAGGTTANPATFQDLSVLLGSHVDTIIYFTDASYFNSTLATQGSTWLPQGSLVPPMPPSIVHSWSTVAIHPLYSPSVFGTNLEMGHPTMLVSTASRDVRGNNMRGILCNNAMILQDHSFNIRVFDQFEKLQGDWDYKLINAQNYAGCGGCPGYRCAMPLDFRLIQTNFVRNPNPINPNVVNIEPYFGLLPSQVSGGTPTEGNGYISITSNPHPFIPNFSPPWNHNLTRGNTLNLMDWMGTGLNQRVTDPNNLPSTWNTTYNRFGWGVVCTPCGHTSHQCLTIGKREWLAEIDFDTNFDYCPWYNGPFTVHYPSYGAQTGQAWIDVVNAGCGGSVQAKLSAPSKNYPNEINQCFEEGIKEITIDAGFDIYEGNLSKRQEFIKGKKSQETGPFSIRGYYPLYNTIEGAIANSPTFFASRDGEDTYGYHIHDFGGQEYYMPNGLELGVNQFHGNWDGRIVITKPKEVVIPKIEEKPEEIESEIIRMITGNKFVPPSTVVTPELELIYGPSTLTQDRVDTPLPTPPPTPPPSPPSPPEQLPKERKKSPGQTDSGY